MGKKGRQHAEKQARIHQAAELKKQDRAAKKEYRKNENRKKGRQSQQEDALFDTQLEGIGLRVIHSDADGNCMFRSIGDQVEGDQSHHYHYRENIMNFINENREDFEPFMEDDEKFDAYLSRMRKDGEWGGHQELYAAARLLHAAFVIHQFNAPMFHIETEDSNGRTYHLSYHGEMHYNSVRRLDDEVIPKTPPQPITLQLFQATESQTSSSFSLEAERLVAISLPDVSLEHIQATLLDVDGNPEHAIELLVSGYIPTTPSSNSIIESCGQDGEAAESMKEFKQLIENEDNVITSDEIVKEGNRNFGQEKGKNRQRNSKKINVGEEIKEVKQLRGGLCHCGSNKKYCLHPFISQLLDDLVLTKDGEI